MKPVALFCLAVLTVLVTGCPHNDYTVELTPNGNGIERRVDFYRVNGSDSNGVPNYQEFPTNELAAIAALYPPGQATRQGYHHQVRGEFSGALPSDVGGAGFYSTFNTTLGDVAFYSERFRGDDDFAARAADRLAAADQLTDLVLGWSRAEFSREPGYKNLRRFIDTEFRHDLKNLALYSWSGEMATSFKPSAGEEFVVRFLQFLVERGDLKFADAAMLAEVFQNGNDADGALLLQRLIADKLGVPLKEELPKSLAFLADPLALNRSWETYLAGTKTYRARMGQWEKERRLKPDLQKPNPDEVAGELISALLPGFGWSSDEDDHLTVRLALASAPDHTNGRWDEARRQVVWESALEARSSGKRLPVFCYASWSRPDTEFQVQHFGRVILEGDELLKYWLWQNGLDTAQAREWGGLVAGLRPGNGITNQFTRFQFSSSTAQGSNAAAAGKELLTSALQRKP